MVTIKKIQKTIRTGKNVEKSEHLYTISGNINGEATIENNMSFSEN